MQTNRKSFGTLKSDRYIQVTVMDEWPLWQVLLYMQLCAFLETKLDCSSFPRKHYTSMHK